MPKNRSKRKVEREYVKDPPRRILWMMERMEEALPDMYPDAKSRRVNFAVGANEDVEEPRLPVLARNGLRRELLRHREARRHAAGLKDTINQLSKPELLTLAKKFRIDVAAIVDDSMVRGKGMASVLEAEELERWEHSLKYPAFVGSLEFDISFTILGKRVRRKAKAEYRFTPEWPYFDLQKKALFDGWPGSILTLHILTATGPDDAEPEEPHWVHMVDLAENDILSEEIWDRIHDAIDYKCKAEDAKRRRPAAASG